MNTVQQRLSMGNIAGLATGEDEMQWHTSGVADPMNFRCQSTPASSECVVRWFFRPPFLPAPDEARVALTAVESIHHVSKSIRPWALSLTCRRLSILLKVPWFRQSRKR